MKYIKNPKTLEEKLNNEIINIQSLVISPAGRYVDISEWYDEGFREGVRATKSWIIGRLKKLTEKNKGGKP